MEALEPQIKIGRASKNVQKYLWHNRGEVFGLIKRFLPILVAFDVIHFAFTYFMMAGVFENSNPNSEHEIGLFGIDFFYLVLLLQLVIVYIYALIAISWHRMVILGKERFEPVNTLFPDLHEVYFILGVVILTAIIPAFFYLSGLFFDIIATRSFFPSLVDYLGAFFVFFTFFVPMFFFIFFSFKMCFYFPAKAVNQSLSIGQSFMLTKGFFWKIALTLIRASFIVGLIFIAYMFAVTSLSGLLLQYLVTDVGDPSSGFLKMQGVVFLINLPYSLFFQPVFTIIGVTVVSNFYLCALEKYGEERP